jgi:23S rRNA (adenine2503-C2)-methyltransferase
MFTNFFKKYKLPKYRISQLNNHYYKEFLASFDEMSTLPKELREKLKKEIQLPLLKVVSSQISKDQNTQKVLFKTSKGSYVESVLMREKDRNTVCVSCMSGCPVGCIFCATGQMGLEELLNEHQIVEQILYFARILKLESKKVTNIVYMGMGEPMLNLENVARSVEILLDKEMFDIGKRRITISTAGYIPNLEKFLNMKYGVKLAVSLHAPTQELRDMLMPNISRKNTLKDLFEVLDTYTEETNKRITYEYVLLRGINDSVEHAKELAQLLKNRLALVNLIDYNENSCFDFKKSKNTNLFKKILEERNINCTVRKSYGDDIKGACGQLGVAKI